MPGKSKMENLDEERMVASIEERVGALYNERIGVVRGQSYHPAQDGDDMAADIERRLKEANMIVSGGALGVRRGTDAVVLDREGNPYDPKATVVHNGVHVSADSEFAVQLGDVIAPSTDIPEVVESGRRVPGVQMTGEAEKPKPAAKKATEG